jgi:histidinol dehydrogenase
MSIRIIQTDRPLTDPAVRAVRDRLRGGQLTSADTGQLDVRQAVRDCILDVERRGDQAVIDMTARFHSVQLTPDSLRVEPAKLAAAHQAADRSFLELVRRVIANIRQYQQSILVQDPQPLRQGGRTLGVRYTPIDSVCVYVPGGKAIYPSTVLMTVVPAQVAGVKRIVMVSPPTSQGDIHPTILALAAELGVQEVYRVAGVAGLAGLAIGTTAMPQVDKIVGPGSAFIAEAKRQLMGLVGIDSIAGPSEVLIVADDTARPDWLAADMLAQAEHDPGSAILVTPSASLAGRVADALETQIAALTRAAATRKAIEEYSAIIVVPDVPVACDVANDFATEHLQIITADDDKTLAQIRHGGAIFMGAFSPVPLGDYCAGPSHVLPTGGTARFFSALSCNDFRKASSLIRYDAASAGAAAKDVAEFAMLEGLTAHANSARMRSGDKKK